MGAALSLRLLGDVTVIDIVGPMKFDEDAFSLRDAVRDLVAKDRKKILVNLGEVPYIDSSGVGELVAGFTSVTNKGGELKLLKLTKRVKDLLHITKLYTIFEVHDNEAEAVRSFADA